MDARSLEKKTIEKMMRIYCGAHHTSRDKGLCEECAALLAYSHDRVDACVFWPLKPSCSKCRVNCYNKSNRVAIKRVMRYSGPRMIYRSPGLTLRHLYRSLTIRGERL